MLGVLYDTKIVYDLLYYHNQKIYNKFKEMQFEPSLLTIQWFICLFTYSLDFQVSPRPFLLARAAVKSCATTPASSACRFCRERLIPRLPPLAKN